MNNSRYAYACVLRKRQLLISHELFHCRLKLTSSGRSCGFSTTIQPTFVFIFPEFFGVTEGDEPHAIDACFLECDRMVPDPFQPPAYDKFFLISCSSKLIVEFITIETNTLH